MPEHEPPTHRPGRLAGSAPVRLVRWIAQHVAARLEAGGPVVRGMLWLVAAGLILTLLNAILRGLSQHVDPIQTMFVRYLAGFVVMLPLALRGGLAHYRTRRLGSHFGRACVHTAGLAMWFSALPFVSLADVTAIGFTGPIFLMLGAALFLGEKMVAARWVATGIGFAGVLIVVAPGLTGSGGLYALMMLATAPVFAVSTLMTKKITREDGPTSIVFWQAVGVTLFTLPAALWVWQPMSGAIWLLFLLCGVMGSVGHYCITRSFHRIDLSATQSARYLDLIWASLFGLIFFGDWPASTTFLGGAVILASTLWIAQREARARSGEGSKAPRA